MDSPLEFVATNTYVSKNGTLIRTKEKENRNITKKLKIDSNFEPATYQSYSNENDDILF